MKKKLLAALGATLVIAAVVRAAIIYTQTLASTVLTTNSTYTLNLTSTPLRIGTTHATAQAVYSSATMTTASFNDGHVATGTITVSSVAGLTAVAATNQITLAGTSTILAGSATNYLVVLTTSSLTGKVITYNGNALVGGTDWAVVATTTGTAQNIAAAFNRYQGVHATRTNSEVDLTALPAGAAGNRKTLSVNTSSITVGGSGFGGGYNNRLANAYLTIRGTRYMQGDTWQATDTSSGTATSIAALIQHISGIRANAVGSVVFATATVAGTAGNSFTLASSAPSYMTVASANFAGGLNNASVILDGVTLTQGTQWTKVGTASGTAKSISDAIMANTVLSGVLRSTWSASGVVFTTSTLAGSTYNYAITTNAANLTVAGMNGGVTPAWTGGTAIINVPSHTLATGASVFFSTSSGVGLSPLLSNATYYVAKIDANNVALSTTSAGAIAGNYITLSVPSLTGPHTFNLNPSAYSGTAGLRWYVSNDGTNYNPLSISSATISAPSGVVSTLWDLGRVNYKYLQLQATAPSAGGLNLTVTINGSN